MKDRKGFTLVELVAVIIVLGVLLVIAIPTISNYIKGARDISYDSHEKALQEAAKAYTIDCIKNNEKNCTVPHDDETINIYVDRLIEDEYIGKLQDPKNQGAYCSADKSFIKVSRTEDNDYEYEACLFCTGYTTDNPICTTYSGDNDFPECGDVTGTSSAWTREPRTITVRCIDRTSGCTQDLFTKTFTDSMENGQITIVDRSGRTAQCTVPVRVDNVAPTCKIVENTVIRTLPKITEIADAYSGVATYGIGTSANTPDYNKRETLTVGNGATRVYGYVKDIAGNEGICSKTVIITGAYSLKYNANGGTGLMEDSQCFSGENCTMRANKYTKANAKFKYWTVNPDGTGQIIHDSETVALTVLGDKLTLYAQWENFEYIHPGQIVFTGSNYVNTGVYLFSAENATKDFEMRLTVNEVKSDNPSQAVLIGDIDEKGQPYYGIIVRVPGTDTTKIGFTSNSPLLKQEPTEPYTSNMQIVVKRVQNKYYYSVDGGATFKIGTDYTGFTDYFEVPATLGARIWPEGLENSFGLDRFFKGTLSNISIKYLQNERVLTFNSNGGTECNPNTVTAHNNAAWGILCTPTREGYYFEGWNTKADGTGTKVTNATVATSSYTVYAQWCPYTPGKTWTFASGSVHTHTIQCTGIYKLEVWGGQGGDDDNGTGGKGGYSSGRVQLTVNKKLYVVVGGDGKDRSTCSDAGGYNGGGRAGCHGYSGAGGGATHIATEKVGNGLLSNYASNRNYVLIVAGGGGGGGYTGSYTNGGAGGGTTGGNATGKGGSQTAGGAGTVSGSFGKGGDRTGGNEDGGGGGGGWFGGGAANADDGGGGGSGYIGGVSGGTMTAGVQANAGSAKITYCGSTNC